QQEVGLVEAVEDAAIEVLLRVLRSARQQEAFERGEVTLGRGGRQAVVERGDVTRLRAAAGAAGDAYSGGIHLRTLQQIIQASDAIPDHVAGERAAGQECRAAKVSVPDRRRGTDGGTARGWIEVLEPFTLADGIERQYDESLPDEVDDRVDRKSTRLN